MGKAKEGACGDYGTVGSDWAKACLLRDRSIYVMELDTGLLGTGGGL